MRVKTLIAAAVLAVGSSAFAATGSASFSSVAGGTVGFSSIGTGTFPSGGAGAAFTDIITFTGLKAFSAYNVWLDFSGSELGLGVSASLLGQTGGSANIEYSSSRYLLGTLVADLNSSGTGQFIFALDAPNASAGSHYTGALEVALVPEPGTYALFVAGLAAVGVMVRRRSRQD